MKSINKSILTIGAIAAGAWYWLKIRTATGLFVSSSRTSFPKISKGAITFDLILNVQNNFEQSITVNGFGGSLTLNGRFITNLSFSEPITIARFSNTEFKFYVNIPLSGAVGALIEIKQFIQGQPITFTFSGNARSLFLNAPLVHSFTIQNPLTKNQ